LVCRRRGVVLDCALLRRVFGVLRFEAGWSYREAALAAAMYEFQRSRRAVFCINARYVADHLRRCGLEPLSEEEVREAMERTVREGLAFEKPRYGDELYLCLNRRGLELIDALLQHSEPNPLGS